jgi:hypothetical protein
LSQDLTEARVLYMSLSPFVLTDNFDELNDNVDALIRKVDYLPQQLPQMIEKSLKSPIWKLGVVFTMTTLVQSVVVSVVVSFLVNWYMENQEK